MTKEEAIEKLADIIFYVSKMGYIPYDTDDEFCAVNIARKRIGELLPSIPSNLDEAAREKAREIFNSHEKYNIGEEKNRILLGLLELEALAMMFYDLGAELVISELFEKLKITPLKVIGKDEYGYPVYDFEVGHYYRTFTLFGEKYKCDQTDSGKAGEQMLAGQGYTRECTVDRTPLNGPAGICLNLHEYDGFKLGDKVIIQIRKKD